MASFLRPLRVLLQGSGPLQFGLLCLLWVLGQELTSLTGLPVPGAVVGLALALVLLATKVLVLPDLARAAQWLISEMLLFFVPAVLALVGHPEFLGWVGLKVLAVIAISTVAVMVVTALVVEGSARLLAGLAR